MITNEQLSKFIEALNAATTKRYEWIRHILLMASGLIGILVSLHTNKSNNIYSKWFFCITIASLGLGILCGSVTLFGEVRLLDKSRKAYADKLTKQMDGEFSKLPIIVQHDRIFKVMEIMCFCLFFIAAISLVIYAILLEMC